MKDKIHFVFVWQDIPLSYQVLFSVTSLSFVRYWDVFIWIAFRNNLRILYMAGLDTRIKEPWFMNIKGMGH